MMRLWLHTFLAAAAVVASLPADMGASVCGTDGSMCDFDGALFSDSPEVSLLQREMQVVGPSLSHSTESRKDLHANSKVHPTKSKLNTDSGAIDGTGTGSPKHEHADLFQKSKAGATSTKAKASTIARAIAWLDAQSAMATMFIIVFGVLACALLCMLGLGGGHHQRDPLRPSPPKEERKTLDGIREENRLASSAGGSPPASFGRGSPASFGRSSPQPPGARSPQTATKPQMQTEVPPICPQLILPNTEARFMIRMNALLSATAGSSLDIMGTSGRKLLHALMCDSPDGRRCLMLTSPGCEEDPRASVFKSGASSFEIYGKAGKFYGWLQCSAAGATLSHSATQSGDPTSSGTEVMKISIGAKADLHMEALTMEGDLLAHAARSGSDSESWKLQSKPKSDAVLISACMLALVLLRTGQG